MGFSMHFPPSWPKRTNYETPELKSKNYGIRKKKNSISRLSTYLGQQMLGLQKRNVRLL